MTLKDTDKLIELIDDDIASLDMNMPTECYYVCLCTLQMVKQYIEALPTVPLDWKSVLDDWTEHDNAMIAKGREIERRLNAPKHGRWLAVKVMDDEADFGETDGAECSVCGYTTNSEYWAKTYYHYCPNCGAKMNEKEKKNV